MKKAAFLLYSLSKQHPYINGNKRTAFQTMDEFLELNGYHIQATPARSDGLVVDVAAGKISLSQVEKWIATNLAEKPLEEQ